MTTNEEESMIEPYVNYDEMVFWGPVSERERKIHARLPRRTTFDTSIGSSGRADFREEMRNNESTEPVVQMPGNEDLESKQSTVQCTKEEVFISSNIDNPERISCLIPDLGSLNLNENSPANQCLGLQELVPSFAASNSLVYPTNDSHLIKFSIGSAVTGSRSSCESELEHPGNAVSSTQHSEPSVSDVAMINKEDGRYTTEYDSDDHNRSHGSGSYGLDDTIERMERLLAMAAEMEQENNENRPVCTVSDEPESCESLCDSRTETASPHVERPLSPKPKVTPAKPPRLQKQKVEATVKPHSSSKVGNLKSTYTPLSKRIALKVPKREAESAKPTPSKANVQPSTSAKPFPAPSRTPRQQQRAKPQLLVTPAGTEHKFTLARSNSNLEAKSSFRVPSFIPSPHHKVNSDDSGMGASPIASRSMGTKVNLPVRKPTYQPQAGKTRLQSVQSPIARYVRDENQPTLIKQVRPKVKSVTSNPAPFQEGVKNAAGEWVIADQAESLHAVEDNKENKEQPIKSTPSLPIVLVESSQGAIVKPMIDSKTPGVYGKMEKLIKGKQNPIVIQHVGRVKLPRLVDDANGKSPVSHSKSPAKEIRAALLNKANGDVCVYSPKHNHQAASRTSQGNLEVSVLQAFSAKKTLQKHQ